MKPRAIIPSDIGEYLRYEPDTGVLYWTRRVGVFGPDLTGRVAGIARGRDRAYVDITFRGVHLPAARIAYFLMTGEQPVSIDHIDCDPSNNRWSNLRAATHAQNVANRRGWGRYGKGVSRVHGVKSERFQAQIMFEGRSHHLGYFADVAEARAAYIAASSRIHGEFGRAE